MPALAAGILGGASILSGAMQSRAAKKAGQTQAQAAEAGIEEQRRQFEAAQGMLRPYREAGLGKFGLGGLTQFAQGGADAYQQQLALAGLLGPEAEAAAIQRVQMRPGFMEEVRAGEEALLQQAAATGGLRGGNIQRALGEFRPQMLRQAIEQEYGRLGGLSSAGLGVMGDIFSGGQASAAGAASQAQRTGESIAGLMGQAGAARAGAALGRGQAVSSVLNLPVQLAGMQLGAGEKINFGNMFK